MNIIWIVGPNSSIHIRYKDFLNTKNYSVFSSWLFCTQIVLGYLNTGLNTCLNSFTNFQNKMSCMRLICLFYTILCLVSYIQIVRTNNVFGILVFSITHSIRYSVLGFSQYLIVFNIRYPVISENQMIFGICIWSKKGFRPTLCRQLPWWVGWCAGGHLATITCKSTFGSSEVQLGLSFTQLCKKWQLGLGNLSEIKLINKRKGKYASW